MGEIPTDREGRQPETSEGEVRHQRENKIDGKGTDRPLVYLWQTTALLPSLDESIRYVVRETHLPCSATKKVRAKCKGVRCNRELLHMHTENGERQGRFLLTW